VSKPATPLGRVMAECLRDAAAAQGLDYRDVAAMFGVKPHYVRRLFRGDVAASLAQLEWYAEALGCAFTTELTPKPTEVTVRIEHQTVPAADSASEGLVDLLTVDLGATSHADALRAAAGWFDRLSIGDDRGAAQGRGSEPGGNPDGDPRDRTPGRNGTMKFRQRQLLIIPLDRDPAAVTIHYPDHETSTG
jgi:transcriptional regulator with XRE-family HTH domain